MAWPEPGERRRWWLRRVGLCLLLGCLTNVAGVVVVAVVSPEMPRRSVVARYPVPSAATTTVDVGRTLGMGFEERLMLIWSPPRPPDPDALWPPPRRSVGWKLTPAPAGAFDSWKGWGLLPRYVEPGAFAFDTPFFDRGYGWPMRTAWCEVLTPRQNGTVMVNGVRGGWALSKTDGSVATGAFRCIPYRPVWRGVAINTAFYAGLWCGLIVACSWLRARGRVGEGCCVGCGYDLLGDFAGGCPECGMGRDGVSG